MADVRSVSLLQYAFHVPNDNAEIFTGSVHTKQTRRRTSAHDHAVLEKAYLQNSKPDKAQRAELVSKVELGEKEVQIWFQNRRQSDRRKSKPLEPHELLAHFRHSPLHPNFPATNSAASVSAGEDGERSVSQSPQIDLTRPSSRSPSIRELLNSPSSTPSTTAAPTQSTFSQPAVCSFAPASSSDSVSDSAMSRSDETPQHKRESELYHGRKRSHDVMLEEAGKTNLVAQARPVISTSQKTLKRSTSSVSLAMTIDGAVKVRLGDELSPSPPKNRMKPAAEMSRQRRGGLERSQSAIGSAFGFKDLQIQPKNLGTRGFGRSRDARTWEFYCDRDAEDALTTQAEAEQEGSAQGVLGLIRSHGSRTKSHALLPNVSRQNKHRIQVDHMAQKSKLSRSRSSLARLESLDSKSDTLEQHRDRIQHKRNASGDSDKENWAPGTRLSENHLRRMHPSLPREPVLTEVYTAPTHVASPQGPRLDPTTGKTSDESKAKANDLDCIQGLLSLSQGAWN